LGARGRQLFISPRRGGLQRSSGTNSKKGGVLVLAAKRFQNCVGAQVSGSGRHDLPQRWGGEKKWVKVPHGKSDKKFEMSGKGKGGGGENPHDERKRT